MTIFVATHRQLNRWASTKLENGDGKIGVVAVNGNNSLRTLALAFRGITPNNFNVSIIPFVLWGGACLSVPSKLSEAQRFNWRCVATNIVIGRNSSGFQPVRTVLKY